MAAFDDERYYESQRFAVVVESGTKFSAVEFEDCVFERCIFAACVSYRCTFVNCRFEGCDLSNAQLPNCRFTDVLFVESKLTGVDWTKCGETNAARLPLSAGFEGCVLDYASFSGLNLRNVRLVRCSAKGADFSEADLRSADFKGSDFAAATFLHTNLERADFTGARNYAIDLTANRVKGARFSLPEALTLLSPFGVVIA